MIIEEYSAGEGEFFSYATSGIERFIGPVLPVPPIVREWLEFTDPERQRRWEALSQEQRDQYIRVVKEMMLKG